MVTMNSSSTTVVVNISGDQVAAGWGKAQTMAVATVVDGQIASWAEHEVGWDVLHGQGSEGTHHARIVRFVRDHGATIVVTGHMGPPMHKTMSKLGCKVVLEVTGDAREAAVQAVGAPASPVPEGHGHGHHH
jgi:predicted Fe-Mo cluster-binding NifX family protein